MTAVKTPRVLRRLPPAAGSFDGRASANGGRPPRRRLVSIGALLIGGIALAWLLLMSLHGGDDSKPTSGRATATATVERRTLVERESVEGALRYSGSRTIVNRLATGSGSSLPSGDTPAGDRGSDSTTRVASPAGSSEGSSSGSGEARLASLTTGTPQSTHDDSQPASDDEQDRELDDTRDPDPDDTRDPDPDDTRDPDPDDTRDPDPDDTRDPEDTLGADTDQQGSDQTEDGDRDGDADGGDGGGGGAAGGETQGSGTVTWLARPGTLIGRGGILYKLDDTPVILMYGSTPAYRRMAVGISDGPDVRQLEANLVALGYGAGVTVDDQFSSATAEAVKRWQASLGLTETGAVELGRVVFLSGARRAGSRIATVGSAVGSGSEILNMTSTRRVVTVELDVAKQSLVRKGDRVIVTLPDGTTVGGRITSIGRVAHAKAGDDGSGSGLGGESESGGGELVIDMTVVLRSEHGISRLDEAPVTVEIAQETKRDALAVPVSALLAQAGGGYAVEVLDHGRRKLVVVRTGLFAGGYVAISGRGIGEGVKVVIPEL